MDQVVTPDVITDLAEILNTLVLSDNKIRSNAENAINNRLAQMPEVYLLGLTQFTISAETEVMRSFASILLRRFLFRSLSPSESPSNQGPGPTLYDRISPSTLSTIENHLLHSIFNETSRSVRRASVGTVGDLANAAMQRGRQWNDLHTQVFSMTRSADKGLRECAFRIFSYSCGILVMGGEMGEDVAGTLKGGLYDEEGIEVRFEALCAAMEYVSLPHDLQSPTISALVAQMLQTLPSAPKSLLSKFIAPLEVLVYARPLLFQPHLNDLLAFLGPFVMTDTGECKTPTEDKPATGIPNNFGDGMSQRGKDEDEEVSKEVRKAVMEFMIDLSTAKSAMVRDVEGWIPAVIRACLEGMADVSDYGNMEELMEDDPIDDPINDPDSFFQLCSGALDRLTSSMGASTILPLTFERIPSMLKSFYWSYRQAALMAIAAIFGGAYKTHMLIGEEEMGWVHSEMEGIVNLVMSVFGDSHPRVRWAACFCIGQLCTEEEETAQSRFGGRFLDVLIVALEAPEPRVHAQAAAALSFVCKGIGRETLIPYVDIIVERLLKLLNPPNGARPKRYVQEQAIATLAVVADASKINFGKSYPTVMPLLFDILRNAKGADYRNLRAKALECVGLTAVAVGRDVFRPDSNTLAEILMWLQTGSVDPGDVLLNGHLITTWAKICQTLGTEFEPYLPYVIPPLLGAAKADISPEDVQAKGSDNQQDSDTLDLYDETMDIPTSVFDEKCQAFETIMIYCSTLQARFAPYFVQCLELTLPSLRFPYHKGVQEACFNLLPVLLYCGRMSNTLTMEMVSASALQLIQCMDSETEPTGIVSQCKCFFNSLLAIGGPTALPKELHDPVIQVIKRHLQNFTEERIARAKKPASEFVDGFMFKVNIENFALLQMGRLALVLDPTSPLGHEILQLRNMGLGVEESPEDGSA